MQRRNFLLASGAMFACALVHAQGQSRVRTIGVLVVESDPKWPASQHQSHQVLRKLGWIEGQNLVIHRRFADFKPERLPDLVRELIRERAEVLFTLGPEATLAAARASNTIPIVFGSVPYPIEQGLIDSFAKPGRNITGTTIFVPGVGAKRLEFLREIAPAAKRVYQIALQGYTETVSGGQRPPVPAPDIEARRLGFESERHAIRFESEIDAALSAALAWGAQAIFFPGGMQIYFARWRIAEFGLRHKIPTAFVHSSSVEAGGLFSYGPSPAESSAQLQRSIEYIDRILRGAHPADLPVQQPRTYELVINLKTAKALGLTIPQSLLLRTDRIIE